MEDRRRRLTTAATADAVARPRAAAALVAIAAASPCRAHVTPLTTLPPPLSLPLAAAAVVVAAATANPPSAIVHPTPGTHAARSWRPCTPLPKPSAPCSPRSCALLLAPARPNLGARAPCVRRPPSHAQRAPWPHPTCPLGRAPHALPATPHPPCGPLLLGRWPTTLLPVDRPDSTRDPQRPLPTIRLAFLIVARCAPSVTDRLFFE